MRYSQQAFVYQYSWPTPPTCGTPRAGPRRSAGQHFASLVVNHARAHHLLPHQFPYDQAVRIYSEAAQKYQQSLTKLPLDEAAFNATLSPEMMVRTRVGIGEPQPAEVQRMIGVARDTLAKDRAWLAERNNQLLAAEARLNTAFGKYLGI